MKRLTSIVSAVVGIMLLTKNAGLIGQLLSVLDYVNQPDSGPILWQIIGSIVTMAITLGVAVFLIVRRDWIADRLVADGESDSVEPEHLLRLGLIVIGVWLAAFALPVLLRSASNWGYNAFLMARDQLGDPALALDSFSRGAEFFASLLQLLIGLFFLSRARVLSARLWLGAEPAAKAEGYVGAGPAVSLCRHCGSAYDPADYSDMDSALCQRCHRPLSDRR